jgi:hypothetical protein
MKYLFYILLLFITSTALSKELSERKVLDYFKDVALKQEFTSKKQKIKKWTQDINVFCEGDWPNYLKVELNAIIEDLAPLIEHIKINIVSSKDQSNYTIFIGSPNDYVKKIEPNAKKSVKSNYGLFWIYWNSSNQIYKGSMYVDPKRAKTEVWQKHLLREELTQSLGLMNDTNDYKDSIFYQRYSLVTSYSDLDKTIIKMLYSNHMKINMSESQVKKVIKAESLIKKNRQQN